MLIALECKNRTDMEIMTRKTYWNHDQRPHLKLESQPIEATL